MRESWRAFLAAGPPANQPMVGLPCRCATAAALRSRRAAAAPLRARYIGLTAASRVVLKAAPAAMDDETHHLGVPKALLRRHGGVERHTDCTFARLWCRNIGAPVCIRK